MQYLIYSMLFLRVWTSVDAESYVVGFVETLYTSTEGGSVDVCVSLISPVEDIGHVTIRLEVIDDNLGKTPTDAPRAIPDTIHPLFGFYNRDPLADYPPPLEGRTEQIKDIPITQTTRVVCYNQILYDDEKVEGDEYFRIKLIIQSGSTAGTIIQSSHSSAVVRIVDNDIKCSRESNCSHSFCESTVSSCCTAEGVLSYKNSSSEICNLCYVYGWVQEIALDHQSATPLVSIKIVEGEEVPLNIYFLRNGPSNQDIISFTIDTQSSATEVEDYILSYTAPLSLTNQPLPVMVSTVDDDVFEEREEIVLTLVQSSYSNEGQILAWQTVVITVSDNDNHLTIRFDEETLTVSENDGNVQILLTLVQEIVVTVTVGFVFTGTASEGQDFITGSSNITLYSRGTLKLSLDIVDDEILEADESLTIMFSNPQPQNVVLGQDSITIIITDNDIPIIGFEHEHWQTSEMQGYANVCVCVGNGPLITSLLVYIDLLPSTAADDDFIINTDPIVITIHSGMSWGCLTVLVLSSALIEGEEHIHLTINEQMTMAVIEHGTASVIIADDGVVIVGFKDESYQISEGTTKELVVRKSSPFDFDISFNIYADGLIERDMIFPAGVNTPDTIQIHISIMDDDIALEPNETYSVTLSLIQSNPQIELATRVTSVSIIDDDNIVTIGFDEAVIAVSEDYGTIHVFVTLLEEVSTQVTVDILIINGTAMEGHDYSMQSSHLIFSERGSQSFAVDILDDTTLEDSEMFSIMLLNPRPDAVMFTSNTIIVIVNDNDWTTISFEKTNYTIDESAGEVIVDIVVETGVLLGAVVIAVQTRDGTAKDGDDYSSVYELLTTYIFTDDPNTIQHLNVSIPITNDTINEGEESFFVVLDLVTKDVMGVELSHPEAEVVVHDDDVVLFGYQDTHVTVEESVGKLSVIVTRSGMTNQHFTLTASPVSYDDTFPRLPSEFQYSNLSESNPATSGVDFSRRNISFSVAPWENTSVIQFEVFDDNIQESSENFLALLYLSESSVGAETSRNIILLTIEDDDDENVGSNSLSSTFLILPSSLIIVFIIVLVVIVLRCRKIKKRRIELSCRNSNNEHNIYDVPLVKKDNAKPDIDVSASQQGISEMKKNVAYGCLPLNSSHSQYAVPKTSHSEYAVPKPLSQRHRVRPVLHPSEAHAVQAYAISTPQYAVPRPLAQQQSMKPAAALCASEVQAVQAYAISNL